jgi:hypothetical protein
MAFDQLLSRGDAAADLPDLLATELITGVTRASTAMTLGRTIPTNTRDSRIPVLSHAPEAFWVSGDTGLKSTDRFAFDPQTMIVEEIAVVVPVPDAVIEDSEFGIWEQLRPLLVRAVARRLDKAVLFGIDKPASWTSLSLVDDAVAHGNVIHTNPAIDDPVEVLLQAAEQIGVDGYAASSAVVRRGWQFRAASLRARDLLVNPAGADSPYPLLVAGLGLYTDPPYFRPAVAEAIVADWSNVVIGIRRDIRIEMFNTGVITDETGRVLLNLLQSDSQACRCTARVAYRLTHPVTDSDTSGSPVAVVMPASYSS